MNNVKTDRTRLEYVSTEEIISDVMTKVLEKVLLTKFRNLMVVSSLTTFTP